MRDHRPAFHITPPAGWLNDPNGLIRVDGRWHLFHQHNPDSTDWGPPSWAHYSSDDLVRWLREPIALEPSGNGPDGGGIWSGCVVIDGAIPTAVYTGVEPMPAGDWTQTVCLARSDRSMRQWTRDPANPVIAGLPHGQKSIGFRDPWVFRDGARWGMLVGSGMEDSGGALAVFRGSDLRSMSFRGFALVGSSLGSDPWTGRMWECPQLARSGETDILVWSVWDDRVESVRAPLPELQYAVVATGSFDGDRYRIEHLERFDHGADCYAPAFLVEPDRILAWAWSWEALTPAGRATQGWAGTLTYPREIWATPGGEIRHAPAPELRALRGIPWQAGPLPLSDQAISSPVDSVAFEIYARIAVGRGRVILDVLVDPDGLERTRVSYDPGTARVEVDRSASSLWSEAIAGNDGGTLALQPGERLELRVFIDNSIVELFVNERLVITERVYPTLATSTGIHLSGEDGGVVEAFTTWPLRLDVSASVADGHRAVVIPAGQRS